MNKLLAIVFLFVSFSFAEDMDMDGRLIPNFTIPKGDTNFNLSRQVEIKKITMNDSTITTREKVAIVNPTYKMNSVNVVTGETKHYGLE